MDMSIPGVVWHLADMVVVKDHGPGSCKLILRVVCSDPWAELMDEAAILGEDNACNFLIATTSEGRVSVKKSVFLNIGVGVPRHTVVEGLLCIEELRDVRVDVLLTLIVTLSTIGEEPATVRPDQGVVA